MLHVDVGGGTTKLALIDNGVLLGVAAFAVGGRLLARDDDGAWTRVDEAAQRVADDLGIATDPATLAAAAPREAIARRLATIAADLHSRCRARCARPLAAAHRAAGARQGAGRHHLLRRRVGIRLRLRGPRLRRHRPPARRRAARRACAAHAACRDRSRPAHPRHRDRRVPVHRAGERQDHPSAGAGRAAGAQRSRRSCRARSRRRDRRRGARRGDHGGARPARPRSRRAARHRVRLARRSRLSPARRRRPRHHGRGRARTARGPRRCS